MDRTADKGIDDTAAVNEGLLSKSKAESRRLEQEYDSLSEKEKKIYRDKNWEGACDLTPFESDWMHKGDSIRPAYLQEDK